MGGITGKMIKRNGAFRKTKSLPPFSFASDMPSRYVRNSSPVHYIHSVVHEHQWFFFGRNFATLARKKKTLGNPTKGFLGILKRKSPYLEKKNTRARQI
jgi:hypothetical protein